MKRLLVMLAACGSDPAQRDPGAAHLFVVDDIQVPANNTDARDDGIDINGDGTVDNQLGMVFGTIAGQFQIDVRAATSTAVKTGSIASTIELDADSFTDEVDADFVLDGHILEGVVSNNFLNAGPGEVVLRIGWPDHAPIELPMIGARAKFTVNADGTLQGVVDGGILKDVLDNALIPAFVETGNAELARDCSASCGCMKDSAGAELAQMAAPGTCTLTDDSVRTFSLVQSLTAPDVTLDGQIALSIGALFTAHPR